MAALAPVAVELESLAIRPGQHCPAQAVVLLQVVVRGHRALSPGAERSSAQPSECPWVLGRWALGPRETRARDHKSGRWPLLVTCRQADRGGSIRPSSVAPPVHALARLGF